MAFDFPTSPTTGQTFTPPGGQTYVWNGYAWVGQTAAMGFSMVKRVFASSQTYVPSPNLLMADVELVGGGGGGAGQAASGGTSVAYCFPGGGGGGYSRRLLSAATIGASQPITIGVGGTGAVATAAGGNGGATSFGALVIANGGQGGTSATFQGGAGGSAAGAVGDITKGGEQGEGAGLVATGYWVAAGRGGSSELGAGAPALPFQSNGTASHGLPASGYGGGGGGPATNNVVVVLNGGNGAPGVCIVTEYIGGLVGGLAEAPTDNLYYGRRNGLWVDLAAFVTPAPMASQVRLVVADVSTLRLDRFDGNKLFINGTNRDVPVSGVSIANSGLAANAVYNVFAYMNAGTMALELSTTGHQVDPTFGNRVKVGDPTRSLVGKIRTGNQTPGQFFHNSGAWWCLNYFNRRTIADIQYLIANISNIGSGPWTVLNIPSITFLSWGTDEALYMGITSYMTPDAGATGYLAVGLNGGTNYNAVHYFGGAGAVAVSCHAQGWAYGNEGYNYISGFGGLATAAVGYQAGGYTYTNFGFRM